MKRIALVHPRYGLEISGGSETYARKIAEHLANRYEVEVLTTKAVDSATWKDWYVRDVEMIRGVTVRRFSVQQMRARDFQAFDEAYLAELAAAPIYIVHVTAKGAMEVIRDRYEKGVAIFGETCTHYLTITTDALEKPGFEGAKAVCSPALRSQDHLDAMWEAVKKGWLNAISSDHCGFNYETHKHAGYGEGKTFADIPNGAPGLENRIPVVWTEGVEKGKISRKKFVELIATNPAKINGLFPQKGTLAVGSDADVVIWDPTYKGTISIENSLQGCDYCAFEGFDQIGRADKVFLRGELVADAGKYVGEKGSGKFVPGKPYGLCYELA